ncbi:peptide ABC transporter substrate-binding protein [Mesorhizobium sp. CN2-181]|uniref:peptide ABC transporter substrate-binding protein n=1 Tax=Mesorhizobium yinganensis TaxID=3157707 RepID=UPI0032B73A66
MILSGLATRPWRTIVAGVILAGLFAVVPTVAEEKLQGGTLVFAHEQEPGTFNLFHPSGQSGAVAAASGLMQVGTYRFPPDGVPVPFIIEKEAEVTDNPFTVTYTIRKDAKFNDGHPITAEDYAFTYETIVNPKWTIANRKPYDLITGYEIIDERTIKFSFSAAVPTYRQLFHIVLPKHDLEGKNWDTAWQDRVPVSNGPFKMESWQRGQQITFVRNEHFFGGGPHLDRIVMRFVPETNTLLELLRSGEIDASDPQPQPEIISTAANLDGIRIDAKTGLLNEYIRFNFKTPGLDKKYVRRAIMMGIDRQAIVDQLMKPVDPNAAPPQSWVFAPSNPHFQPKFESLGYNPEGAVTLLEDNGCRRGADQIFVCDGAKLDFGFVTTAGSERRELTFEIVQAYLQAIGISVRADFSEAAAQFGTRGPQGQYDLFVQGGLFDDPISLMPYMGCEGKINASGYCNPELDAVMNEITVAAEPDKRAELLNKMDSILADDLPFFPVFGLSRMVVYNANRVGGFNVSPFTDGVVSTGGWYWNWNAQDFYRVQ